VSFENLRERIREELCSQLQGFDVLIAHNVASLHKNLALTAALYECSGQPGFPRLILWHHDLAWTTPRYRSEMHDGYPWQLLRQPWPGATQVVISELRHHELAHLFDLPESQILVVPNGVDLNSFFKLSERTIELVEELNLLDANPLFLLPVRLTPRKNIELALQIIKALRNEYPQAMLLVTGPEGPHNPANRAYRQKLLQLRDDLHLQGAAHFLAEVTPEFLPDEVIADFYRLADALLFPSREEGFGIPLIEAGFSGIPVFCADIPVLRELGGTDLSYFDPDGDPSLIAEQISTRLQSETTLRWSRRAKHGYTWRSIDREYIQPLITGEGKV
jgi:glycosyltransferase involved in cell wall biosynthesis